LNMSFTMTFVPRIFRASEALVTLPGRIARAFAPGFDLVVAQPPLPLRGFAVPACWHRRNGRNPRLAWLVAKAQTASAPRPGPSTWLTGHECPQPSP
jgi:DNA-binding transcriptional LysR family regulator